MEMRVEDVKVDVNNFIRFSINNVSQAFRRITESQAESIFDDAFFSKLKEWNRNYNLKTKLFVVESEIEKYIRRINPIYLKELYDNREWLQIEWGTYVIDGVFDVRKYKESFLRFNETIKKYIGPFNGRRSIRLGFDCIDEEFLDFLTNEGISGFYSNHIKDHIYDFKGDINVFYGDRKVSSRGRDYRLTDIDLSDKSIDFNGKLDDAIMDAVNKYKFYEHIIVTCVDESEFDSNVEIVEKMMHLVPNTKKILYLDAYKKYKEDFYFISNGTNMIFKLCARDMSVSISKVLNRSEMISYEKNHSIIYQISDTQIQIKAKDVSGLIKEEPPAMMATICWAELKRVALLNDVTINESRWIGLKEFLNEVICV